MDASVPAGVFFGETVLQREVAGFRYSEARYAPGLQIPNHSHACANFSFVLQGSYTEFYEGRTRRCVPETLVFHPLAEVHSDRHDLVDVSLFCVEIEPERLETVREHSVVLDRPGDFRGGLPAHLGAWLYREFRLGDDVTDLAMEGLTLQIMAEASRRHIRDAERQPPRWLRQAADLLHSRYADTLTLAEIAHAVGIHPVHLAREFRRHYHCTVADYVRGLRTEAARRCLAGTHAPLGEIALSVGFADQSHFTRTFKRLTGMTPAEYRRTSAAR